MSNRNNRMKYLEKQIRKIAWEQKRIQANMSEHDIELMELQEENSELRKMLDEQNDYIKQVIKENKEEFASVRRILQSHAMAMVEAKQTFIGKHIFK